MTLNRFLLTALFFACTSIVGLGFAQETIYRCGNEYTNDAADAKANGCQVVLGGNVTIIQAPKFASNPVRSKPGIQIGVPRTESVEQRQRDADAKAILEAELRKGEQLLAQLRREYNDGQPEKMPNETKNYQKYMDRVSDLRKQITRAENDIASVKRELTRFNGKSF